MRNNLNLIWLLNKREYTAAAASPVAEQLKAASAETPSRGRAPGAEAELCPSSPVSPSGSPGASLFLSACWPSKTPSSLCCLLHLLWAPCHWILPHPACLRGLLVLLLQVRKNPHLSRFAHPLIWWASPRTSSLGRDVWVELIMTSGKSKCNFFFCVRLCFFFTRFY